MVQAKSTQVSPAVISVPAIVYIDKNGKVKDTLQKIPEYAGNTGEKKPAYFPEGIACFQQALSGKINLTFRHKIINCPIFKASAGKSLFSKSNIKNLFFFLVQADSNNLFFDDDGYSLLRFMRYMTFAENHKYSIVNSSKDGINDKPVKYRDIVWGDKLKVRLYENNKVLYSYFDKWEEFEKIDYAPVYPTINLSPISFYAKNEDGDKNNWLLKPQLLFGILEMGKNYSNLSLNLDSLHGKSRNTQLVTSDGKTVKGTGIDLDNDGSIDVFWYSEILHLDGQDGSLDSISRLYIKADGEWILINYRHLSEFF